MNNLMLVVLAVVLLCYCGGKYCPKILSSNKEMLLGVLVGVALCSFAGLRMEGLMVPDCEKILKAQGGNSIESGFAPPSCVGYPNSQRVNDQEGDNAWCRNQIDPTSYCSGLVPDCDKILKAQGGNIIESGFAPPSCVGYPNSQRVNDPLGDDTWCNNQIDPSVYCNNPYVEMQQKNQLREDNLSRSGLNTNEGSESLLRQLRNNP